MIDRSRIPDPFEDDAVADPHETTPVDVALIHQNAFRRCCDTYDRVVERSRSWSVLLYGEAGCGKTHLLGRFRRWLSGQIKPKPSASPAVFVSVRMRTSPGQVWAWTRRRLIEEITKRQGNGLTLLDQVLANATARLDGRVDSATENSMGLNLAKVLRHFAQGHERALCRAWLAGDSLSDGDRDLLNLGPAKLSEDEQFESDSEQVVLSLVRLCSPAVVVFCFDQLEALSLSRQNLAFAPFARMGASIVEETPNSLLVSSVLVTFLKNLQEDSRTDFDRIARERVDLQPLDWKSGVQLIGRRLATVPELPPLKPIQESDLRAFYKERHDRANPRDLIQKARELFREWQGQTPAPGDPHQFLQERFDALCETSPALNSPAGSDAILNHALPVLFQILGYHAQERPGKRIDLRVESNGSKLAICYGNHADMRSYAPWLKAVQEQATREPVALLRDIRLPIGKNAVASRRKLEEISEAGGKDIRVKAEALAALDAMRRLLSEAKSEDLTFDGKAVAEQTVREWLARNLPRPLAELGELLTGRKKASPAHDALIELVKNRKTIPLAEAATATSLSLQDIEDYARANPDDIHLFKGSSPVLCAYVPIAIQRETDAVS